MPACKASPHPLVQPGKQFHRVLGEVTKNGELIAGRRASSDLESFEHLTCRTKPLPDMQDV
jgi:hypothetical protein